MLNKYLLPIVSVLLLAISALIFYNNFTQKELQKNRVAENVQQLEYSGSIILPNNRDINSFQKNMLNNPPAAGGNINVNDTAKEITQEAIKAFSSRDTSLPLLTYTPKDTDKINPDYMLSRIEQGEHLLVTWNLNPYYDNNVNYNYYESSIKKAAQLKLPLVFVLSAPESALLIDDYFTSKDDNINPAVINNNGDSQEKLSPFADETSWSEVGEFWAKSELFKKLQEWYPNPPLVVFMSKNEEKKLTWNSIEDDSKYIKQYKNKHFDNNQKRTFIGANWIEKYRLMHESFKNNFTALKWKNNTKFVSNNQLSQNIGVKADWNIDATYTNLYANIWPLTANGLSVDFDLLEDKGVSELNSPYATVNNLAFMLDEAKKVNPDIAINININENNKITQLDKYRGFAQFGLWFIRPNIITKTGEEIDSTLSETFFNELANSIELIHADERLKDFWLNGHLVSNGKSPFNEKIPENLKDASRWFLLDVDVNENQRSKDGNIEAWAFALEKGEGERKEIMIFTQSPNISSANLRVKVPGYKDVEVKASKDGAFVTFNTPEIVDTAALSSQNYSSEVFLEGTILSLNNSSSQNYSSEVFLEGTILSLNNSSSLMNLNNELSSDINNGTTNTSSSSSNVIESIRAKVVEVILTATDSIAKVEYSSNEKVQAQLEYGESTGYGKRTTKEESFRFSTHIQSLTGLKASTTYHYRVHFWNRDGKETISKDYVFKTLPSISTIITNPIKQKAPYLTIIPGLYSFGTETRAAYGGSAKPKILHVNDLGCEAMNSDETHGTFKWAITRDYPRVVVFDTSGEIHCEPNNWFDITSPYMTIAGQTAPKPGVILTGIGLAFKANDMLVEHLTIRPGKNNRYELDSIAVVSGHRLVFNQLSLSWANDEVFSTWGANSKDVGDITLSNSIIAEGLLPHSCAILLNRHKNQAIFNNLISTSTNRAPYLKGGGEMVVYNNIIYNMQIQFTAFEDAYKFGLVKANIEGNIYKRGPVTDTYNRINIKPIIIKFDAPNVSFYQKDNVDFNGESTNDFSKLLLVESGGATNANSIIPVVQTKYFSAYSATLTEGNIINKVGARPSQKSPTDRRIMNDYINGTGELFNSKNIPEIVNYKINSQIFIPVKNPHLVTDSGYTNLEVQLRKLSSNLK